MFVCMQRGARPPKTKTRRSRVTAAHLSYFQWANYTGADLQEDLSPDCGLQLQ